MKRIRWLFSLALICLGALILLRTEPGRAMVSAAFDRVAPDIRLLDSQGESLTLSGAMKKELRVIFLLGDRFKCAGCTSQLREVNHSFDSWKETVSIAVTSDGRSADAEEFWEFLRTRSVTLPAYFDPDDSIRLHYRLPPRVPLLVGLRGDQLAFAVPFHESFWLRVEHPLDLLEALFSETLTTP